MVPDDNEKIESIIAGRTHAHQILSQRHSKTYTSFLELEKNAFATGKLERKYKELIALGISIDRNCESCIEWHVAQALEFGATFDELFETVDVSIEMGGGPATVAARFVIKVIEYYQHKMIRPLQSEHDLHECTDVIRRAFKPVADEFKLTVDNAPTHPSHMTLNILQHALGKGIVFLGIYHRERLIGCIGIEQSPEKGKYYVEKLAVLPEYQHKGFGALLMETACRYIRERNGTKVSIGIINEHIILKKWYSGQGFTEYEVKRFSHLPFAVCFMEKGL